MLSILNADIEKAQNFIANYFNGFVAASKAKFSNYVDMVIRDNLAQWLAATKYSVEQANAINAITTQLAQVKISKEKEPKGKDTKDKDAKDKDAKEEDKDKDKATYIVGGKVSWERTFGAKMIENLLLEIAVTNQTIKRLQVMCSTMATVANTKKLILETQL